MATHFAKTAGAKHNKKGYRFLLSLNEEQKQAKREILENTVSIVLGKAGSGKTLLACQIALQEVLDKRRKKIIITRPTISKEDLGHLPGNMDEQTLMILQRIGLNSRMMFCGDSQQIDLKHNGESGLKFLSSVKTVNGLHTFELLENHRHPILDEILDVYRAKHTK